MPDTRSTLPASSAAERTEAPWANRHRLLVAHTSWDNAGADVPRPLRPRRRDSRSAYRVVCEARQAPKTSSARPYAGIQRGESLCMLPTCSNGVLVITGSRSHAFHLSKQGYAECCIRNSENSSSRYFGEYGEYSIFPAGIWVNRGYYPCVDGYNALMCISVRTEGDRLPDRRRRDTPQRKRAKELRHVGPAERGHP